MARLKVAEVLPVLFALLRRPLSVPMLTSVPGVGEEVLLPRAERLVADGSLVVVSQRPLAFAPAPTAKGLVFLTKGYVGVVERLVEVDERVPRLMDGLRGMGEPFMLVLDGRALLGEGRMRILLVASRVRRRREEWLRAYARILFPAGVEFKVYRRSGWEGAVRRPGTTAWRLVREGIPVHGLDAYAHLVQEYGFGNHPEGWRVEEVVRLLRLEEGETREE